MNINMFITLLFVFSVLTGLVTEAIKKIIKDKENMSYNIIALVTALIIGVIGTGMYYQLNDIVFSTNNIIYMILLGLASALVSMVGFDKFKQALVQCGVIKKGE